MAACIIALACAALVSALGVRMAASDVADIRGVEPSFVYSVQKLLLGRPMYTDPEKLYYDITEHSFVYPYAVFALSRVAGIEPGDAEAVTRLGRSISLALELALLALLYLFCTRVLRVAPALAGIACSALLVLQAPWGFLARPDALLNCCTAASWCATAASLNTPRPRASDRWIILAAGMGVLAFFAKQTGIQVIAMAWLFLLLTKSWRRFFLFSGACAACLLLAIAVKAILFGSAAWQNTGISAHAGLDLGNAWEKVYRPLFMEHGLGFVLFGCMLAVGAWLRPEAGLPRHFLAFALGFAFLFAAATSLRAGSAYHYFNDFLAIALAALAGLLHESFNASTPAMRRALGCALAALVLCWLPPMAVQLQRDYPLHRDLFSTRTPVAQWLRQSLIQEPDGLFFTTDTTLANMFPERAAVPLHHAAAIAYESGDARYTELQERLDAGQLRVCVVGFGQEPERQLGFLGVKTPPYVLDHISGPFSIWTIRLPMEEPIR